MADCGCSYSKRIKHILMSSDLLSKDDSNTHRRQYVGDK